MKYINKEVVYIEYQDGKPFSVCVAEPERWTLDIYDFEPDCKNEGYFMYYNSGSGGYATEIAAPTYREGCEDTCCFWIHPKAKLKGTPENIKQIQEPLMVNGSLNPFDDAREVFDTIYCKFCDMYLDEDWCEHLHDDDEGNILYMNGEPHES